MRPDVRRVLRWVRHAPSRVLHPMRRRAASRQIASRNGVRTVLFLCNGNICRSPYAAVAFAGQWAAVGGATVRSESAGFIGPHRPCPPEAIAAAAARGVALAEHRSRVVDGSLVGEADLVLVMDPRHRRLLTERVGAIGRAAVVLGDLDPGPVETRAIIDPIDRGAAVFERVYDRIDRCLRAFGDALTAGVEGR